MSCALDTQPAARKAALLSTLESTLIKRSPTPSLIDDRYAVRSWYSTKLRGLAGSCMLCVPLVQAYSSFWRRDMARTSGGHRVGAQWHTATRKAAPESPVCVGRRRCRGCCRECGEVPLRLPCHARLATARI